MEPLTTMEPFATELELIELLMRTYADESSGFMLDAVYCYVQTTANTPSVVLKARKLFKQLGVSAVAIPTYGGLPKYEWYYNLIRTMILDTGIRDNCINPIPHPPEFKIAHTHTEAIGLIRYAKEKRWKQVYITALPSHLLRAFLETITAVVREYPELQVYSTAGVILPWTEPAEHSQTVEGSPKRFESVPSELEKIRRYHAQGDLISAREALDYLNRRAEL